MTVEDLIVYGKKYSHSEHTKILLAELLNLNSLELLNHLQDEVEEQKVITFKKEIEALEQNKPLQYVLGNVNFYGNYFFINENVLIPRFETEQLVENTINYINKLFTEPVEIIDLGCGSGVIGLTLAKKLSPKSVDLIDISKEALEVTKKNATHLGINANIYQSDMLKNVNKKYDVIISNPPYIKINEEIEQIVKDNEPQLALYAGEDGLCYYEKILSTINPCMKDSCLIAFEIGYQQATAIQELAYKYLDNIQVEIKKDLSGKDRMLFIFKNLV